MFHLQRHQGFSLDNQWFTMNLFLMARQPKPIQNSSLSSSKPTAQKKQWSCWWYTVKPSKFLHQEIYIFFISREIIPVGVLLWKFYVCVLYMYSFLTSIFRGDYIMISLSNRFVRALWKQGNNLCKLIVIIFLTEICWNGVLIQYIYLNLQY